MLLAAPPLPRGCTPSGLIGQMQQLADLAARDTRQFATGLDPETYQPCGTLVREELHRKANWAFCRALEEELAITRQALLQCQEALAKERRRRG